MPSDVKSAAAPAPIEPPSAKLLVQLFVVPLVIVGLAVGVMFMIGFFAGAGATPSVDQALQRLSNPGGQRTADVLVGPGSKQRYMDAKAVADKLLKIGATPQERIRI